jgi:hypothetical protein
MLSDFWQLKNASQIDFGRKYDRQLQNSNSIPETFSVQYRKFI